MKSFVFNFIEIQSFHLANSIHLPYFDRLQLRRKQSRETKLTYDKRASLKFKFLSAIGLLGEKLKFFGSLDFWNFEHFCLFSDSMHSIHC